MTPSNIIDTTQRACLRLLPHKPTEDGVVYLREVITTTLDSFGIDEPMPVVAKRMAVLAEWDVEHLHQFESHQRPHIIECLGICAYLSDKMNEGYFQNN